MIDHPVIFSQMVQSRSRVVLAENDLHVMAQSKCENMECFSNANICASKHSITH